jgi:PAS domain S-box-containing protein
MQIPDVVRLLLVEGSEETSNFIKDILKNMKYSKVEVSHVKTLKEAREFDKDNIDVILLDLVLPNSDGIETFKNLRNFCHGLPIIIISEFDDLGCNAVKKGAQDFLPPQDLLTSGLLIRSIKYAIERKKLEEDLKNSKVMYQEIVESTNAAIYEICFKNDKLTYVNDVMARLTGWSRTELLNMGISDLLTDRSKLVWLKRYQAMSEGKKVLNTVEYEVKVKNGSTRWVMLTASYKTDEGGGVVGARVVALDITDRKTAQFESQYKEQLVYNDLEQKLIVWRRESQLKNLVQEQQLREMDVRIMSISDGVV